MDRDPKPCNSCQREKKNKVECSVAANLTVAGPFGRWAGVGDFGGHSSRQPFYFNPKKR
jgi:hypothetical protein